MIIKYLTKGHTLHLYLSYFQSLLIITSPLMGSFMHKRYKKEKVPLSILHENYFDYNINLP